MADEWWHWCTCPGLCVLDGEHHPPPLRVLVWLSEHPDIPAAQTPPPDRPGA